MKVMDWIVGGTFIITCLVMFFYIRRTVKENRRIEAILERNRKLLDAIDASMINGELPNIKKIKSGRYPFNVKEDE